MNVNKLCLHQMFAGYFPCFLTSLPVCFCSPFISASGVSHFGDEQHAFWPWSLEPARVDNDDGDDDDDDYDDDDDAKEVVQVATEGPGKMTESTVPNRSCAWSLGTLRPTFIPSRTDHLPALFCAKKE